MERPALTGGHRATVAARATPIVLRLRPGTREWYRARLSRERPGLLPLYRRLYARGSYTPDSYRRIVTTAVREVADRHGLNRPGSAPNSSPSASPGRRRRVGTVCGARGRTPGGDPAESDSPKHAEDSKK
ncbi:hypothetical protein [Nocardiopsis sp. CC223A]|uniref:hypothetical protein n=1 Tax=Nocardiopsis sp. CC223A TaxID=3044051 RepID=UPI00278BFC74|nr:hypothetical protein [Nocardiopsis sp. CC223A]